ncbi:MAG: RidA family protein [Nitrospinales bacterium]
MEKRAIKTENAPAAIGPYEQAIRIGEFLYTSGQIAIDPKTGEMVSGDIEAETDRVLKNLQAILSSDGMTFDNVIKTTVYLADMENFARMNKVYESFFSTSKPARSCVQAAALPKGANVEIDIIAVAN